MSAKGHYIYYAAAYKAQSMNQEFQTEEKPPKTCTKLIVEFYFTILKVQQ